MQALIETHGKEPTVKSIHYKNMIVEVPIGLSTQLVKDLIDTLHVKQVVEEVLKIIIRNYRDGVTI